MKIGMLIAMDKEAVATVQALPEEIRSKLLISKCGIGKVNAAVGATEMIERHHPECILSIGCAGSLGAMSPGEVLIAGRVAYHDVWCGSEVGPGQVQGMPRYFDADPHLLAVARNAVGGEIKFREGLLVTGDQFYVSEADDRRIKALYPLAEAADMESAAIAQVCHLYGVSFLSIRIISDSHTSAWVQQETYNNFWDSDLSHFLVFVARVLSSL